MTIDDILDKVIAKEGGFVGHPDDRGGAQGERLCIPRLISFLRWC